MEYSNTTLIYHGKKFDVVTIDANKGKKEVVLHPGACVILPFLNENEILLIKNKRPSVCQTLWELPAGTLEKDEPHIECAYRELIEETGYLAKKMEPLLHFFASPGYCNEMLYAFSAHELEYVGQDLDETEEIEVVPTTFTKALDMIHTGQIIDAKTISTLLFYRQFHS